MGPDFRVLIAEGRKDAQEYFLQYQDPIPVGQLVREVASTMQEFTQSGSVPHRSRLNPAREQTLLVMFLHPPPHLLVHLPLVASVPQRCASLRCLSALGRIR